MKKWNNWKILACGLALSLLCGGVAVAAGGEQGDPLITLSYLQQTFLPQVMSKVEEETAHLQNELSGKLSQQIDQYKTEMEENFGSSSAEGESAAFQLITMTKGQVMALDLGTELMLRVGTATVNAGVNPALIDVSTGGTLNKGSTLTKNHLYMATMVDRTVTATADTVKLLVRGGYTLNAPKA